MSEPVDPFQAEVRGRLFALEQLLMVTVGRVADLAPDPEAFGASIVLTTESLIDAQEIEGAGDAKAIQVFAQARVCFNRIAERLAGAWLAGRKPQGRG